MSERSLASPIPRAIRALGALRHLPLALGGLALAVSAVFCFVVYPLIATPYHAVLDPDNYGGLARGLLTHTTLAYFPDPQPTLSRGPVYPAFVAMALALSGGWWPQSVQAGQCVLFALTCGLVFWLARRLWSRPLAAVAALAAALHPLLVWYTSRVWVETLATFLLSAVVATTFALMLSPAPWRALLAGSTIGVACLCKATFLPLLVALPLLVWASRAPRAGAGQGGTGRAAVLVLLAGMAVVGPWTLRNWALSGRLVPVQVLAGYNFQIGDAYVEDFSRSPWGFAELRPPVVARLRTRLAAELPPGSLPLAKREVAADTFLLRQSLARYRADPLFLGRKLALHAWMFWTLGETPAKTLVIAVLQLPLVTLFAGWAWRLVRGGELLGPRGAPLVSVVVYGLGHLPIYAVGRFSVVLVPTMLACAVGMLERRVGAGSALRTDGGSPTDPRRAA